MYNKLHARRKELINELLSSFDNFVHVILSIQLIFLKEKFEVYVLDTRIMPS